MKVGIVYNRSHADKTAAERISSLLEASGVRSEIFADAKEAEGEKLLVLGGDGTLLHAAKRASALRVPLVGINYGRIGFLTEFEHGEEAEAVSLLLDEGAETIRRSMLEIELNGKRSLCLNELALLRGVSPERHARVEKISVTIDGSAACDFFADGLIVATPTGSTAYSLSAGGSILMPECASFLLTPVCAFSLLSRPISYPDRCELRFSLKDGDALIAYGDGDFLGSVGSRDVLTVKKAQESALFLTRSKGEFFRRLTQKLN